MVVLHLVYQFDDPIIRARVDCAGEFVVIVPVAVFVRIEATFDLGLDRHSVG